MEKDITKGLVEQSGEVINKAYEDLVHPTAEPLGQMLSYLPRTIRLFFAKWERWLVNGEENLKLTGEALKDKVSAIPKDKICEPEPYVAIPAMQQIAYCYDSEELRNMYANLLASSMNKDKKWSVHPGYVDIIKQLTPDEAKLLKVLPKKTNVYLPVVDLKIKLGDHTKGERIIKQNYTNIGDSICESPESIGLYLDDLIRLKIIDIPYDRYLVDKTNYDKLKNSNYIKKLMQSHRLTPEQKFDFNEKILSVTEFGLGFISCCIDEPKKNVITVTINKVEDQE